MCPNDDRRGGPRCPICGRPPDDRYRPFCSRRCADVDLHRWLGEVYRIPDDDRPDDDRPDDRPAGRSDESDRPDE